MILKRDENYIISMCLCIVGCALLSYICSTGERATFWTGLLFPLPAWLVSVIVGITSGRTFIMDAEGCTVILWKYKRKYTWQELKTKKYNFHRYRNIYSGITTCAYGKGAIFSPRKLWGCRFISRYIYSMFNPLSCIIVNFTVKNSKNQVGKHHEVEESVFREKMEEWGVVLEDK